MRVTRTDDPAAAMAAAGDFLRTGTVTRLLLNEGEHPILYTQLANPTSNAVYRRLGYEPVAENVRYTFGS